MKTIEEITASHKISYKQSLKETTTHPLRINSTLDQAKRCFNAIAQDLCYKKNRTQYVYDEDNKEQITEILKYLICDPTFKGFLHKGLLICGSVGTGKSLIMEIIKIMIESQRKMMQIYDAAEINEMYARKENHLLTKGIICIDDLGTESKKIIDFGTEKAPVYDMLTNRYRLQRITFATSNLAPEDLQEYYDERFSDRCDEMFNTIPLVGKSRRK